MGQVIDFLGQAYALYGAGVVIAALLCILVCLIAWRKMSGEIKIRLLTVAPKVWAYLRKAVGK